MLVDLAADPEVLVSGTLLLSDKLYLRIADINAGITQKGS